MQTNHQLFYKDSSQMNELEPGSINLVVTSPPYPMIEMWDELFSNSDSAIERLLNSGSGKEAFEKMHRQLDRVWCELNRVMAEGSMACIIVGDAVRRVGDNFKLFANHARIIMKLCAVGFDLLPVIIWRKQTNAPNKFMGSGMLPGGAYVTLEHEYILIFRKSSKRKFKSGTEKNNRRKSALFWEERNCWFSDLWEFKGIRQGGNDRGVRRRSAAYPFMLPYRLINMFSVYGDTVLDPFLGTGTTTLAAMASARNSIGYEFDNSYRSLISNRINREFDKLNDFNKDRITFHLDFIGKSNVQGKEFNYRNRNYGFPIVTAQEQDLLLYAAQSITEINPDSYRIEHVDLMW